MGSPRVQPSPGPRGTSRRAPSGWARLGRTLLVLLTLGCGALSAVPDPPSEPEAPAPSAKAIAHEAVEAVAASRTSALHVLANFEVPDMWEIVDELLAQGARPVAEQLVEQVQDVADRRSLLTLLDEGRSREADPALRARFDQAMALEGEERIAALKPLVEGARGAEPVVTLLAARAAYQLAREHHDAFDIEEAVLAWRRALDLASNVGWTRGRLEATLCLGVMLRYVSGAEASREAREALSHAEYLARPYKTWLLAGDAYRELGNVLAASGGPSAALDVYMDGAAIFKRAGDASREAQCLTLAGGMALELGDLARALDLHQRAHVLAGAGDDAEILEDVRINTATLYEMSGRLEEALELLNAIVRDTSSRDPATVNAAIALGNRARCRYLAGDVEGALTDIDAAQARFERMLQHESEGVWQCMHERGWYQAGGRADDASLGLLRAEIAKHGTLMAPKRLAHFYEAIGRGEGLRGRTGESLAAFREAVRLAESGAIDQAAMLRADLFGQLSWCCSRAGRDADALEHAGRYVDGLLGHVEGIDCASNRTFRGIVAREALEAGLASALRVESLDRAWRMLEAARGIRLLAALGGRSRFDDLLLPAELKREIQTKQELELSAREALSQAQRPPYTDERRAKIQAARAALQQAVEARLETARRVADARNRIPLSDLGGSANLASLDSVRSSLPPGHVVVALSLDVPAPEILAIVVERAKPPRLVALKDRDAILAASGRLRGVASQDRGSLPEARATAVTEELEAQLAALRSGLIAPLGLPAGMKALTVLPDGPLALVPYGALLAERGVPVSLQSSGTLFVTLLGSTVRGGTHRMAVGVGDYTGRALGADLAVAASFAPPTAKGGMLRLRPLPHAADEARQVAGPRGTVLVDAEATGKGLLDALEKLQGVPLLTLHFACHGLAHGHLPTLSGLALSDGMLTAQEILSWRLTTDMVVLSACDTATDPFVSGQGMTGLVRSFLFAGAPRVIASLWKVPDEPTSLLMAEFYRLLAADPRAPPSACLRDAQTLVRTMDGGKWASPENWAAWTLWGAP